MPIIINIPPIIPFKAGIVSKIKKALIMTKKGCKLPNNATFPASIYSSALYEEITVKNGPRNEPNITRMRVPTGSKANDPGTEEAYKT